MNIVVAVRRRPSFRSPDGKFDEDAFRAFVLRERPSEVFLTEEEEKALGPCSVLRRVPVDPLEEKS